MTDHAQTLAQRLGAAPQWVWVEVSQTQGSVPREVGTWMLVSPQDVVGTIGGGRLEFEAIHLAREGLRHLKAALVKFEKQVINGTTGAGDAAGFTGFRQATTVDALADAMVVNAAGTTAATASSVWAVRIAPDGVCGVYKGPSGFELGETTVQQRVVDPGTDNKTFPTYYTPGFAWMGLQVGSAYDIGRIANVTADSGKGMTDALAYTLLSKFPVGFGPTHWLMSRRSVAQLRASRTATNATGAPAPFPTEIEGIPIVVTDAIADTEALLT